MSMDFTQQPDPKIALTKATVRAAELPYRCAAAHLDACHSTENI